MRLYQPGQGGGVLYGISNPCVPLESSCYHLDYIWVKDELKKKTVLSVGTCGLLFTIRSRVCPYRKIECQLSLTSEAERTWPHISSRACIKQILFFAVVFFHLIFLEANSWIWLVESPPNQDYGSTLTIHSLASPSRPIG
ncbi:hypothetical protein ACRRTK_022968 [Alexandromys fortis]